MHVLRSLLFAPGNHARRVAKAFTLEADAVILDLEDAVAVHEKAAARELVAQAVQNHRNTRRYVRVNPIETSLSFEDIEAVMPAGPDGILLPKVEDASTLQVATEILAGFERRAGFPAGSTEIVPLIETARGLANLQEIAGFRGPVRRLSFGAGDYTNDVGAIWSREEEELLTARSLVVIHSRAAGLEKPLDTVWIRLDDAEGLRASCERARRLGFAGKFCIHPGQLEITNQCFSPSAEEIEQARRIVAAFDEAEAAGNASIRVGDVFVDYPIVERARAVVASASKEG